MRVAAIDCGTNSIRLLVAAVDTDAADRILVTIERRTTIVRLGQDVDRTGRLAPARLRGRSRSARTTHVPSPASVSGAVARDVGDP